MDCSEKVIHVLDEFCNSDLALLLSYKVMILAD